MSITRPCTMLSLAAGFGMLTAVACQTAGPPPYVETQQQVIDVALDAWNRGNLEGLDAVMSPQVRRSSPSATSDAANLAEFKEVITGFRTAYPDAAVTANEVHHLENLSFVHWTFTGTNTGEGEMPPTGESVRISGVTVLRFAGGVLTEEQVYFDALDWMTQLGHTLVPPEAEADTGE